MRKLLTGSGLLLLAACAPQGVSTGDLKRLEKKLNDVRSFQGEQTAELSGLQEEVRQLTGRLEQLEYRGGGSTVSSRSNDPVNATGSSPAPTPVLPSSGVLAAATPPPIVPIDQLEEDEAVSSHLDVQIARLFQDGLYFIRRGQYRQALPLFDQISAVAVGKEGHGQSIFWKGVCYDGMGNNRDALAAYNSLIQNYPNSTRARVSLLRLASVFIRLGDTNTAKLTLQKLIAEAPGTKEASMAKEKLGDL